MENKLRNKKTWVANVAFCFLLLFVQMTMADRSPKDDSSTQKLDAQKLLKKLNKPAVKSIKSPDGDIIDRVDILKQPALDHPKLKNHKIRLRPSSYPEGILFEGSNVASKSAPISQLWHRSGSCPEGTIPIRRIKEEDILRDKNLQSSHLPSYAGGQRINEHASVFVKGDKYYGGKGTMNVWNPKVPQDVEWSVSAIWVMNDGDKQKLNAIFAGWQSPDGDIIDCVHISHQPAFDNPKLKNHKIQMRPTFLPKGRKSSESKTIAQLWHQRGTCPEGTIPIRRTTKDDLLRASSFQRFGMKDSNTIPNLSESLYSPGSNVNHEYATSEVQKDKYYGAKARINVWKTHVQQHNEYSVSQIWVINQDDNDNVESVEAGWQVHPMLYGDDKPRFYSYWTSDSYGRTGCYNLQCSGFVQVSNAVSMGATLQPLSIYGGTQYEISLLIWKDRGSGNWWLRYGDTNVGYWPASLFDGLPESATLIQWGGEVLNRKSKGTHTTTEMGSGSFSREGLGKFGYFNEVSTVNENNTLVTPDNFKVSATKPNCYDIRLISVINVQSDNAHFFYGGPGKNSNCPI